MSLDSEAMMMGTAAEELLDLYLSSSRPLVVLGRILSTKSRANSLVSTGIPNATSSWVPLSRCSSTGNEGEPHGQNDAGPVSAPGLTQCQPKVLVFVLLASPMKLLEMSTLQLGVLLVGLVPIGLPVWGALDAAAHPKSTWQRVGLRRRRSKAVIFERFSPVGLA